MHLFYWNVLKHLSKFYLKGVFLTQFLPSSDSSSGLCHQNISWMEGTVLTVVKMPYFCKCYKNIQPCECISRGPSQGLPRGLFKWRSLDILSFTVHLPMDRSKGQAEESLGDTIRGPVLPLRQNRASLQYEHRRLYHLKIRS